MLANYHTHTWRCKHADGDERAYIEQAIQARIQILGFADHTPYPFPDGHVSSFRMAVFQAEDYFRVLSDLKREYAGQIQLCIGFEAEYYPSYFDSLLSMLRDTPCEYLLLGQHFLGDEEPGTYCGTPTDNPENLRRYVDQVLAGLSTGYFTYLAHPDLLHWRGDGAVYRREMTRLCQGVKDLGYPLEINLLGMYSGRNYPCEAFWQIAGEVGNQAIIGCDAHTAEALNRPAMEARARAFAAAHGVSLVETIPLHMGK